MLRFKFLLLLIVFCSVSLAETNTDTEGPNLIPSGPTLVPITEEWRDIPKEKIRSIRDIVRYRWINRVRQLKDKLLQLARGEVLGYPEDVQARMASLMLKDGDASSSRVIVNSSLMS